MNQPQPGKPELTPILLTVKDAAKLLGVSAWTCYQLIKSGDLEARYMGPKRIRVPADAVEKYAAGLPTKRDAS